MNAIARPCAPSRRIRLTISTEFLTNLLSELRGRVWTLSALGLKYDDCDKRRVGKIKLRTGGQRLLQQIGFSRKDIEGNGKNYVGIRKRLSVNASESSHTLGVFTQLLSIRKGRVA